MPANLIRMLLLCAAGLSAPGAAGAQSAPFPDWARRAQHSPTRATGPAWRAVPPALRPRNLELTRRLRLRGRLLRGSCRSGTVAVWKRAAGTRRLEPEGALATSFTQVRSLAAAAGPGGSDVVIVCGRRATGAAGLELWSLSQGAPLPPGPLLVLGAPPDELWLLAGIVDGRLYVVDGIGPRLLRFSAPAWLADVPCLFDAAFRVLLRTPRRGGWEALVPAAGAVVGLAARAGAEPRDVVLLEHGRPAARWRMAAADRALLDGAPVPGQQSFHLVEGARALTALQVAPRATGPWVTRTPWTATGPGVNGQVTLIPGPAEGAWLRTITWRGRTPGPAIRVGRGRSAVLGDGSF